MTARPLRKEGHEASTYTVKAGTKHFTDRNPDDAGEETPAPRTALSAGRTEPC